MTGRTGVIALFCVFLTVVAGCGVPPASAEKEVAPVDVFLLLGQSNAVGVPIEDLSAEYAYLREPILDVRYAQRGSTWTQYDPPRMDHSVAMVHHLYQRAPAYRTGERRLALYKSGWDGTSTQQWGAGLMDQTVADLNRRLAELDADPTISSVNVIEMLWVQGEADVVYDRVPGYVDRFQGLHEQIRREVMWAANAQATIVHLNQNWDRFDNGEVGERAATWNEMIMELAQESPIVADIWMTDPQHVGDGLHYSAESFARGGVQLGEQYLRQYGEVLSDSVSVRKSG